MVAIFLLLLCVEALHERTGHAIQGQLTADEGELNQADPPVVEVVGPNRDAINQLLMPWLTTWGSQCYDSLIAVVQTEPEYYFVKQQPLTFCNAFCTLSAFVVGWKDVQAYGTDRGKSRFPGSCSVTRWGPPNNHGFYAAFSGSANNFPANFPAITFTPMGQAALNVQWIDPSVPFDQNAPVQSPGRPDKGGSWYPPRRPGPTDANNNNVRLYLKADNDPLLGPGTHFTPQCIGTLYAQSGETKNCDNTKRITLLSQDSTVEQYYGGCSEDKLMWKMAGPGFPPPPTAMHMYTVACPCWSTVSALSNFGNWYRPRVFYSYTGNPTVMWRDRYFEHTVAPLIANCTPNPPVFPCDSSANIANWLVQGANWLSGQ